MQYRGLTLDRFQEHAIQSLAEGKSALVCAPTGTGKTIIADWIVEQALQAGRQVVYTAPVKALSNQKYRDYVRLHGEENVGLVTGDLVIRRDAPCLVMTTEILRNILLGGEEVPNLHAVVLDEIHFLDDRERGTVWEEVLIYLPQDVQVVGLSATLSNLESFAAWLENVRQRPIEVVVETTRAVPLTHHLFSVDTGLVARKDYERKWQRKGRRPPAKKGRNERGSRRRPPRKTTHLDTFDVVDEHDLLPFLYFVFSRRDTERCARALGRHVRGSLVSGDESEALRKRLRQAAMELGPALDDDLRELYSMGIGFHHAGLHVQLKALVEELYEAKLIKVLYTTSTFALGINMPARSVAFDSLRKFDGKTLAPLSTREFMQMAGRAGRRGLDEEGHVIARCDFSEYEEVRPQLQRYEAGATEPVRSSFNLSWNSIVNLLATHDMKHIREIVNKSFLSFHLERAARRLRDQAAESEASPKTSPKQARKLHRRADRAETRCWDEFEQKIQYLQSIGYLAKDRSFKAGARVLANIQISEILTTELVLSGVLEDLEPAELFGVCCSITNQLGRHVRVNARPSPHDKFLAKQIIKIVGGPVVSDAHMITDSEPTFDPELLILGQAWAEGKALQEVLMMLESDTDVAGDLISGFRRAKDLIGQLRDVYRDDEGRHEMLVALARSVTRDEVEVVG